MAVHIEMGQSFEVYDDHGALLEPTPEDMAAAAFRAKNAIGMQWYVPQIQWVKEYRGQITNGRVGRPVIGYAPLSWLGTARAAQVAALIAARETKETN